LKALLPRYEGRVKCVYIDPPYNTGNENWVYNDNVNAPRIRKWLGQVVGREGEDISGLLNSVPEPVPEAKAADPEPAKEEVAETVLFLLSAPAYLTGQIITLDGGYL